MPHSTPHLAENLHGGGITRRDLTRRAALLGLSLPSVGALVAACGEDQKGSTGGGKGGAGEITWVDYGGSYNEALQKSIVAPFEKDTGISVRLGENTSLSTLKLQVTSGNVQWDIAELTGPEYEVAVKQDLLEPYNYDIIDTSTVPKYAVKEFGIKYALFLYGVAWDQRAIADRDAPRGWVDFWDTRQFPEKRSLYEKIDDGSILEVALIADGVPFDDIYPLDVERALKSLERLGGDNFNWHSSPQEAIRQLTSGELPLATSWNGRVGLARRNEDAEINFSGDEAVVSGGYLGVPRGAPNAELAFRLINYIVSNPQVGAEYSKLTFYAIANSAAIDLLPADVADKLATSPALEGKVLVKDDGWWAENFEATTTRFREWQLAG